VTDAPEVIRSAAIAAHGEAWRFLEMPSRSASEDAAMIKAALKSLDLWKRVGSVVNEQRGLWLVARAYIAAEQSASALDYARRTLAITETHRHELEDFDLAFAEEIAARAFALSGDQARTVEHYTRASELGKAIEDSDDRRVFFDQFDGGPWFGFRTLPTD
jgi:hypothetical protein